LVSGAGLRPLVMSGNLKSLILMVKGFTKAKYTNQVRPKEVAHVW